MPSIEYDTRTCQGYGNCAVSAPDIFGVDDNGLVVVHQAEIGEGDVGRVTTAIRSCPVNALRIGHS
ncbi:ferredoxin [Nocardia sp. CA-290969]|uniref:ferredoxin n=1 Tax=Nocardia sp. CA-290969 TaxID=3239986 RepID=UPI003D91C967